ncbi:predicted protein [Pyrenophora tritici-repentis Pt-1C-BFP]|uniref:Uncharacterized protein n=1 Tax=Pyrenophora tritici-repentis (strain Pt-1C-BFP) TaxID=426418 RepID=B2WB54_PYRTR|nr:uncharacterized protein PTRG_06866 [Pyrenophora tritici-repentis Pt-1C-BFP]EDU49786.1 predicted protein [Pyrenophora tritici-repentis Pt-1C-BFP]
MAYLNICNGLGLAKTDLGESWKTRDLKSSNSLHETKDRKLRYMVRRVGDDHPTPYGGQDARDD